MTCKVSTALTLHNALCIGVSFIRKILTTSSLTDFINVINGYVCVVRENDPDFERSTKVEEVFATWYRAAENCSEGKSFGQGNHFLIPF
jgi:hypothetical protein